MEGPQQGGKGNVDMQNRQSFTEDVLRRALGATDDCPTIEELESLASGDAIATGRWTGHLQACGYCQTELHMLQTFLTEKSREATPDAGKAAELLEKKRKEILKQVFSTQASMPWWKSAFTVPRIVQASFAAAAIFLVVGAVLFFRSTSSQPQLEARNQTGPEVLRSNTFALLSPVGDVQERPTEMRWEAVPGAASYQVQLLEVDRSQVWKANTTDTRIELPEGIRARIVPAKTLFGEVTALDASGKQIGGTELVRFRLVPSRK